MIRSLVILGGAHGALALARAAGALGIPVTLATGGRPIATWSRHIHRHVAPATDTPEAMLTLLSRLADELPGPRMLIATGDLEVSLVSQNRDGLAKDYEIPLPGWSELQWLCEKPLLYRRAASLGVAHPRTYHFRSLEDAGAQDIVFPVVLKPNMGGGNNDLTRAKAIRAGNREAFNKSFRDAVGQIGIENVVVQELIPGGGECQFSYAALWRNGVPMSELTARRSRQYPVDFGYTSTFVETIDDPGIVAPSRALLASVGYDGLVEIEFKRDDRQGMCKVLDVNPRPWAWLSLGRGAGADLARLLLAGEANPASATARPHASWMYFTRDLMASLQLAKQGELAPSRYFAGFRGVSAWASFAPSDPLPGLVDLPLTCWRVVTRRILRQP